MSSHYFDYSPLSPNTLARASDVNARFNAVLTAFDKLPHFEALQQSRTAFVTAAGSANALVITSAFPLASYVAGLRYDVQLIATNTGAATVNADGLGAKTIKRSDGAALLAGDLTSGQIVSLIYDGTAFRLLGASEIAAANSAAAAASSASAAANSETNAANSATSAADSATNAANSATAAANSATDAANSAAQAETAVSGYVAKAGSTMTGALVLYGAPAADLEAATKKYVDEAAFAAGNAYTADGATITLTSGTFSLTTIANATVLGNVSGGVAKPGALSTAQLTTLIDPATATLKGAMSAADKSKLDAITGTNTGDQTTISGNAGSATVLQTARTIGISGAVTGTGTSFDGSANITIPITAMNMDSATSGVLAVARGGTGVTTATGTGSVVLSSSATLTSPTLNSATLSSPSMTGTPTAPTAANGNNSTQLATTAYVKNAIDALPNLSSGTYTPTITGVSNVNTTGSTSYPCQWIRVGNVIHISGKVAFDSTAAGVSNQADITIPIASNFTQDYQGAGVGAGDYGGSLPAASIRSAGTKLRFFFTPGNDDTYTFHFTATYQVL